MERKERINMMKACIIANCKRVIYLLETNELERRVDCSLSAELKQKMAEIRRDMVQLGKDL